MHELGHSFGLCDEYDTCVWGETNTDMWKRFGMGCPNSIPNSTNSDCGNSCCTSRGACCYGKYADNKTEKFVNVMGSTNIPPERRFSTETKSIFSDYLCKYFRVCVA
jgi:hypothetical protein